jgi:hypothetical protein
MAKNLNMRKLRSVAALRRLGMTSSRFFVNDPASLTGASLA